MPCPSRRTDLSRAAGTLKAALLALACSHLAAVPARGGLLAFYPFEGNADDASGHANHGTVSGAVLTELGYEGQAYEFDGSNDFISTPVNMSPGAIPRITVGAWARTDTASGIRAVVSQDNGGFDRNLNIDARGAGAGFRYSAFTGTGVVSAGPDPAPVGAWVFVATRYNDVTDQVTLDVGPDRVTAAANPGAGNPVARIGSNPGFGEHFDGRIDNVFIFDEVLSDARIDAIREGGAAAIRGELSISAVGPGPGPSVVVRFVAFPPVPGTLYRLETAATAEGPWLPAAGAHLDEAAPFRYRFTLPVLAFPPHAVYRVGQTVP